MNEPETVRESQQMINYREHVYPFTAIVGQDKMKLALLLNALNPRIGGVLIRGHRGTAKSTAARALARLLPEIEVVKGCPFNCDLADEELLCPFCHELKAAGEALEAVRRRMTVVTLPLGASEDRVLGTTDIEKAIKKGEKHFEPGVLADTHRGVLYVDEVNLLDDHIVDVLLDAAAMEVNTVEREGISFTHPTRFILVGTMNPEEGELRPQLLDRFGLCVNIEGENDLEARTQIVKYRIEYERSPQAFVNRFEGVEDELRGQIVAAQNMLPEVTCPDACVDLSAQVCLDMGADGHRADIVVVKTAVALAAFEGRTEATEDDIYRAAELALAHRMHKRQAQETRSKQEEFEQNLDQHRRQKPAPQAESDEKEDPTQPEQQRPDASSTVTSLPDASQETPPLTWREHRQAREGSGRRGSSPTKTPRGSYVMSRIPAGPIRDVALDATMRAAAIRGGTEDTGDLAVAISTDDIRVKVRRRRTGAAVLFVVDSSGSMGMNQRMAATKGAILSLLNDAYQRRDRVALIMFRGQGASVVLPFTSSVDLAERNLTELPTGGKTPLAAGLVLAQQMFVEEERRRPNMNRLLVVISDGKANVPLHTEEPMGELQTICSAWTPKDARRVVIDPETGFLRFDRARQIAEWLDAHYFHLDDLTGANVASMVSIVLRGG